MLSHYNFMSIISPQIHTFNLITKLTGEGNRKGRKIPRRSWVRTLPLHWGLRAAGAAFQMEGPCTARNLQHCYKQTFFGLKKRGGGRQENRNTDLYLHKDRGFPGGSVVKNSSECRRLRFNPWFRKIPWRSKCSCQENSMDRGAWQATVHGVAKSQI